MAGTLETVRERGAVACGIHKALAGFADVDPEGRLQGLDVDLCRAVAAAVLGDAEKVAFVPVNAQQRFSVLQSGEIDLLVHTTTWTLVRDTALGLNFAGINFYDGQGFLVPRALAIADARQLSGATLCMELGTTSELNAADWFRRHGLSFEPLAVEDMSEAAAAFFGGRCDAYTGDLSALAAIRAAKAPDPAAYEILPETISKEPLGPVVRHGDDRWLDIVRWTLAAMVTAEELGIRAADVPRLDGSSDPRVRRLLGARPAQGGSGDLGEGLGLDARWAARVVAQVGNYGESYDRTIAARLGLPRGRNALWRDGGLMYGLPFE